MRNLFSTSGRIGRLGYFVHSVADVVLIGTMFGLIYAADSGLGIQTNIGFALIVALGIIGLGAIIQLSVSIRRFHDINMSGWWLLGTLVPIVNLVLSLLLLFKPGDPGDNRYGPQPEGIGGN